MTPFVARVLALLAALVFALPLQAQEPAKIGIVVMHGKGGSPERFVSDLALGLRGKGLLVENLEMPWSGGRNYDADVASAEKQVQEALDSLRARGARKVFVAGHSQGGVFTLHLGGRVALDGIIPIAPGGDVGTEFYRQKVGASLEEARKYVADGKGGEKQRLMDFEGSRGTYPVVAVPAAYVTWFDPDGAMNQRRAQGALKPGLPVLLVVPKRDYLGLLRVKDSVFRSLPPTPHTRLYEPDADHLHSPGASVDEIARWTREVADAR